MLTVVLFGPGGQAAERDVEDHNPEHVEEDGQEDGAEQIKHDSGAHHLWDCDMATGKDNGVGAGC